MQIDNKTNNPFESANTVVPPASVLSKINPLNKNTLQAGITLVNTMNPASIVKQTVEKQNLDKQIHDLTVKCKIANNRAIRYANSDPVLAAKNKQLARIFEQKLVQLREERNFVAHEEILERVGKLSAPADIILPGAGQVVTAAYAVAKVVHLGCHYLSKCSAATKVKNTKEVITDLAVTGGTAALGKLYSLAQKMLVK